jgi:hypothetical protein
VGLVVFKLEVYFTKYLMSSRRRLKRACVSPPKQKERLALPVSVRASICVRYASHLGY